MKKYAQTIGLAALLTTPWLVSGATGTSSGLLGNENPAEFHASHRSEETRLAQAPAPRRVTVGGNPPNRRYGIGMAPPQGGEASVTILEVSPGHVAAEAGLEVNDKITRVNGTPLADLSRDEFIAALRSSPLTLVVDRDGESMTFEMSLENTDSTPPAPATPEQVAAYRSAALQLADLLEQRYLFPEVGAEYAQLLRANAATDHYAAAADAGAFANQLTADLLAVSEDRHLRVIAADADPRRPRPATWDEDSTGVRESGWLQDKVAFMRISLMPDDPAVQEWADAFMREHSEAEALILDLRHCRGGTLTMMNGFLPYLL